MSTLIEIKKIVEYKNSRLLDKEQKSKYELDSIIKTVTEKYKKNEYDFKEFSVLNLSKDKKVRKVYTYKDFSLENILCIYMKRLLEKKFYVKYPNRNKFIHSLFDIMNSLKDMNDYTIYRFDFKKFFDTISNEYVFEKYIKNINLERYQIDLINKYVQDVKYCHAGFNVSNIFCEIISRDFDELLRAELNSKGAIYYRRYVDDGIIVFNQYIEKEECKRVIENIIEKVFRDNKIICKTKCKVTLNLKKEQYISRRNIPEKTEFDFLGYLFCLEKTKEDKIKMSYGITKKKIDKYNRRIENIVLEYKKNKQMELLRQKIKAFCFRIVYRVNKKNMILWKDKGFIANYSELRYRTENLTKETEMFLKNAVKNAFGKNEVKLPYFLKESKKPICEEENIYNLYNNLKRYKSLIFIDEIGIKKETLIKLCRRLNMYIEDTDSYEHILQEYLLTIKVGH